VYPDGTLSPIVADRVAEAYALYRSGAVDRIIVSGDHGDWSYNEPGAMRDVLLARCVPPQHIFTDHAGFDTWATMTRTGWQAMGSPTGRRAWRARAARRRRG